MKGIARRVRLAAEGQKTVLRFRLETAEGRNVSVELRGREIRGDLDDGDTVELSVAVAIQGHAVVRPSEVMNLTTDSVVQAWNPPLLHQAGTLVAKEALSAVVGAGATLTVGGLLRVGREEPNPRATNVSQTSSPSTSGPSTSSTNTSSTSGTTTRTIIITPAAGPPPTFYIVPILLTVLAFAIYVAIRVWRRRRRRESLLPLLLALGVGFILALLFLGLISAMAA
jgi:hypothetical protein